MIKGSHHSEETKRMSSECHKRPDLRDDLIIRDYLAGESAGQIAIKYNCNSETIRLRLISNGIERRTQSENMRGNDYSKGRKLSEEHRRKISDANRRRTQSPETRRKIAESKIGKKRKPFSEDWKRKLGDVGRGKKRSDESKLKMSAIQRQLFKDEGRRKRQSELAKKQWQDPKYRDRMSGENNCMKRPEVRAKVSGENCWLWKGGISYEPYCPKFNESLKEEVREAFGRKCYLCPTTEEENGERLSVHHVDYKKSQGCNGQKWSLLPLCHKCHTKTSRQKWFYFCLLRDYWICEYIDFFNFS